MFHVLIDTSVWLDLAENQNLTPLLTVLVEFFGEGQLELLVPRQVITEFQKNRHRVAKASAKSLASHFNLVKDAIRKVEGDGPQKEQVLDYLCDVNHRIPVIGGAAEGTLTRIEELLSKATIIEASDATKARAADRAISRKAPCHHENKNSMADALLIEIYIDCVKTMSGRGERFAFVTHNVDDFSLIKGNHKLPHADLAPHFSKIKSLYFIQLADLLRRVDSMRVSHLLWELEWDQQPRGLTEILKWTDRLTTMVWHNRHMNREYLIEKGKLKVVTREKWEAARAKSGKYNQNLIVDEIWEGALRSARAAEKQLGPGPEGAGPYTDFEWGMVNGKLSALRWILGEDWDELYT
jgi:hypothetical protein